MTATRDNILRERLSQSKNRAIVLRATKHRETRQERRRSRARQRVARQVVAGMEPTRTAENAVEVLRGSLVAWLARHDPRLASIIKNMMQIEDGKLLLPFSDAVPRTRKNVSDLRDIAKRCGFKMTISRSSGGMRFTP